MLWKVFSSKRSTLCRWLLCVCMCVSVSMYAMEGSAQAKSDGTTGVLWGAATAEVGLASAFGIFFSLDQSLRKYDGILIGSLFGALGLGVGVGVLAGVFKWTPIPARVVHFGFWLGAPTWALIALGQSQITPWAWGFGIGAAILGGLAGGLVGGPFKKDIWFGIPPAVAGIAFAGVLVVSFFLLPILSATPGLLNVLLGVAPLLSLGSTIVAIGVLTADKIQRARGKQGILNEPDKHQRGIRVRPTPVGIRITW